MNLNEHFIHQINALLPSEDANAMLQTIKCSEPVTSVRFNNDKGFLPPSTFKTVPWCKFGTYLNQRQQFTFDPHFHAGSYYVQDASSMFIYHVIKSLVTKPVKYLDLCAAPGGKTTAALQSLPQGSLVVANEIVTPRAQVLRENVIKWGHDNCIVTNDSPKSLGLMENTFDIIATDVPCSGEGMFRKDEEAVSQWSPQLVAQCSTRQRDIINDIWPALKPGGLLIYSTCTYNLDENEKMVLYIASELGASFVDVPTEMSWNITGDLTGNNIPCYRFMPHLTKGEGLFLCVLRKNEVPVSYNRKSKPKKQTNTPKLPKEVLSWLNGNYELRENNGIITAVNKEYKDAISLPIKLHVIKGLGIELGTIKGNKIIPSHQLAMSPMLSDFAFGKYEVDYSTAIAFLRGEAITINAPRGYNLITYQNAKLGFVNNLGNRANNLYPKNWRILSTHMPYVPPCIMLP